jgi:FXSXX-COOH protein
MTSIDAASPVSSTLPDLRSVRLAEMPTLSTVSLEQALRRVLPDSPLNPVPVAAFQSAI